MYTVDVKGVAVIDYKNNSQKFLEYPEAAVWCILIDSRDQKNSVKKLKVILAKSENETNVYIDNCVDSWRNCGLIL